MANSLLCFSMADSSLGLPIRQPCIDHFTLSVTSARRKQRGNEHISQLMRAPFQHRVLLTLHTPSVSKTYVPMESASRIIYTPFGVLKPYSSCKQWMLTVSAHKRWMVNPVAHTNYRPWNVHRWVGELTNPNPSWHLSSCGMCSSPPWMALVMHRFTALFLICVNDGYNTMTWPRHGVKKNNTHKEKVIETMVKQMHNQFNITTSLPHETSRK